VIEVGYYTGQSVCPSRLFIGEVQSIEVDSGSNKVNWFLLSNQTSTSVFSLWVKE